MGELVLHVVVAAHRDELWQDFVDMSLFAQWWWPFADTTYVADVREGGTYRFASESAGIGVHGSYLSVIDTHRLDFSWQWEDDDPVVPRPAPSTVRIAFTDADDATTTVEIVHEAASDELESLRQGWEHCLQRLVARYA